MRIAYFPDSFHEVNGVAHTSRNFFAYAQRHGIPFLCIHAGVKGSTAKPSIARTRSAQQSTLQLRRSRLAVRLEKDLWFDPLFFRYAAQVDRELQFFRPDVIHVTGPSELGIFGAYFAWKHRIPLAASWHTNLHEYAARRLAWLSRTLPQSPAVGLERGVEAGSLAAILRFYRLAGVLYAPNQELCDLLETRTGKPCHLMQRGVDTDLFTPARRTRGNDGRFVLGYVGRLSVEKNVALLIQVERQLQALGIHNAEFLIVGHGNQEPMLRRRLHSANFTGVLRGESLAAACANMDALVFPSHTDTFGNVVLEALAGGVPAVVTPSGGPRFIVRDGETGFIAPDIAFASAIAHLAAHPARLARMRAAARAFALTCSWDAVFHRVLENYGLGKEVGPNESLVPSP